MQCKPDREGKFKENVKHKNVQGGVKVQVPGQNQLRKCKLISPSARTRLRVLTNPMYPGLVTLLGQQIEMQCAQGEPVNATKAPRSEGDDHQIARGPPMAKNPLRLRSSGWGDGPVPARTETL